MPPSTDGEQRRRRRKHPDERDSPSSRDKTRSKHKSSSSTKLPLQRKPERDHTAAAAATAAASESGTPIVIRRTVSASMRVPEMERRSSCGEHSNPPSAYPTFSKAHSREAVGSREDMSATRSDMCAPHVAGADKEKEARRSPTPAKKAEPTRAPPSPPLTADEPDIGRSGSGSGSGSGGGSGGGRDMRGSLEDVRGKAGSSGRPSVDGGHRSSPVKSGKSGTSLRKEARFTRSDASSIPASSSHDTERKSTPVSSYRRTESTASREHSTLTQDTQDTTDSDATSIAPDRNPTKRPHTVPQKERASPPSVTDSQPKTPTQEHEFPPHVRATPIIDVGAANTHTSKSFAPPLTAKHMPPPPPPPPPPMTGLRGAPRVDYLLKNGGLSTPVPKRLVQSTLANPIQSYNLYQSPALSQAAPMEEYTKVFSAIHKRLDDYMHVLRGNGSLAVATGYKSVARRLLDKLSQVFARDISSQRCDCVVCKTTPQPTLSDEEDSGISWGEILEFVAGRRELPPWPPFSIEPDDAGLGISGANQVPMQKLDIDVPDEYRDHYIRQNQKTKRAVQSWLSQQPDVPSTPPEEADEDTLMFAMMTKLPIQQRNLFIALMHGQNFISEARAPTPAERPATSSKALRRAKKALQRLYRLERPPRDCEAAMYLLNNPHLHGMLATMAEVNEAEWDILVSGRFDGFLWSGAEAAFPPFASAFVSPEASRGPSRGPNVTPCSRNTTPFTGFSAIPSRGTTPLDVGGEPVPSMFPSRGPTPGVGVGVAAPAPVQLDEDTEVAVVAELERNLFLDMERLEDAFEILHGRAETVRQMLRERSAGLSAQAQLRRGSGFGDPVGVRLDTPASGTTQFDDDDDDDDDDDGLGDTASLAPDDSASQISTRRHRHRHQRRTPGPEAVPEEDESVFEEHAERPRRERPSADKTARRPRGVAAMFHGTRTMKR